MLVGAGRQFGDIIWGRKRPKKGHLTANNGSFPQQPTTNSFFQNIKFINEEKFESPREVGLAYLIPKFF